MHGLITLVSDNHVDNYLKEILVFVYYGSIVNDQPNNGSLNYKHMHAQISPKHRKICCLLDNQ